MAWCPGGDKLDQDIFDALAELVTHAMHRAEEVSQQFGVPVFCAKAMHRLDTSVAMKELGKRMHCDPSFVTMIADSLEQRGLARREPNAADRRIKNLVLTPAGLEMKDKLEQALLSQMPWCDALDLQERETLLALMRKMINAARPASSPRAGDERTGEEGTGEVSETLSAASQGAHR